MPFFVRWILVCAAFATMLRADLRSPAAPPDTETKETAQPRTKPKRLRWLRRIGSAEVGLAMKLSAIGIERPPVPRPAPASSAAGL
jgi:hypothetical protein